MPLDRVRRQAKGGARALSSLARAVTAAALPAPQRRARVLLGPAPAGEGAIWSAAGPAVTHDAPVPTELLEVALRSVNRAYDVDLGSVAARGHAISSPYGDWATRFPGEHYRLLAALVEVTPARLVVEVGTLTGASALALAAGGAPRVVTYDIVGWRDFPDTLLTAADFTHGALEQRVVDLSALEVWCSERDLFAEADLIFLDGPKDGVFEPLMLDRLAELGRSHRFHLVIDDIRFLEMLEAWGRLAMPKMDLTSFGHWSGTGLALATGSS